MKRWIKAGLAGGLLGLTLFSSAMAGPFEDGLAAYQKGDYAAAMQSWRPLAEQGNAPAQFNLGSMYERGRGVPQDYLQAMIWYRKARDQSYAVAEFKIGLMYEQALGVPQSYADASSGIGKPPIRVMPSRSPNSAQCM